MLGADIVGFQMANYARHWRQTVSRILSYEALPRDIQIPEGEGLTVEEARAKDKGEINENARVRDGIGERGRFVDVGVFSNFDGHRCAPTTRGDATTSH
jgi:trehalose 6-phosphate synthase/phosphatase